MKRNISSTRLFLSVLVAFAGTVGHLAQADPAVAQEADQPIMIQGAQATSTLGPAEIGVQAFSAMVPGKVVKGAPYSAVASTEMTQVLSDGNQIRHKMTSNIYRDSQGRTRREENFAGFGPLVVNGSHPPSVVFISDPVSGSDYVIEPDNKIARKVPSLQANGIAMNKVFSTGGGVGGAVGPVGPVVQVFGDPGVTVSAESRVQRSTESLGQQSIEGVVAEGKRITTTIPAGAMGNQRPITTVTEEWLSSELQVVVLSTTKDPRVGETTYRLTNIQRSEPPATLFTLPADYAIKDFDRALPLPRPPQSNE
jgi:hypothetical protein